MEPVISSLLVRPDAATAAQIVVALTMLAIGAAVFSVVARRRDLTRRWAYAAIGAFLALAGLSDLLAVQPGIDAVVGAAHLAAAAAGVGAAIALARLAPAALASSRSGPMIAPTDQTAHAQRLEALGALTGGVAHDFNNVLSAILANLQLMRRTADEASAAQIDACLRATRRGAEITKRLLAFARRQPLTPTVAAVKPMLDSAASLVQSSAPAGVRLRIQCEDADLAAYCDALQLETVVVNLMSNAVDAIALKGDGDVVATARAERLDAEPMDLTSEVATGAFLLIDVVDDGVGMDAPTRRRSIEPFFTTKTAERGSGLGLSMALGFARQSGGFLDIVSAPGAGATVRLYLPIADAEQKRRAAAPDATPDARPKAHSAAPTAADGGGPEGVDAQADKTVLVIDDDHEVLDASVRLLTANGFRVLPAIDGASAKAYLDAGVTIDVVVCDVLLAAGEDGVALTLELRRRAPRAAAFLMTGAAERRAAAGALPIPVLDKPVDFERFADALKRL